MDKAYFREYYKKHKAELRKKHREVMRAWRENSNNKKKEREWDRERKRKSLFYYYSKIFQSRRSRLKDWPDLIQFYLRRPLKEAAKGYLEREYLKNRIYSMKRKKDKSKIARVFLDLHLKNLDVINYLIKLTNNKKVFSLFVRYLDAWKNQDNETISKLNAYLTNLIFLSDSVKFADNTKRISLFWNYINAINKNEQEDIERIESEIKRERKNEESLNSDPINSEEFKKHPVYVLKNYTKLTSDESLRARFDKLKEEADREARESYTRVTRGSRTVYECKICRNYYEDMKKIKKRLNSQKKLTKFEREELKEIKDKLKNFEVPAFIHLSDFKWHVLRHKYDMLYLHAKL